MVVKIQLAAPMQSWGIREEYTYQRTTSAYPTKSGITGLIACAMGIKKEEVEAIKALRDSFELFAAIRPKGEDKTVDVQLLADFQTIHPVDADGNLLPAPTARNSNKAAYPTVIKEYVMDTTYDAYIKTDKTTAENIVKALRNPVYPLYLGRKVCTPSKDLLAHDGDVLFDDDILAGDQAQNIIHIVQ